MKRLASIFIIIFFVTFSILSCKNNFNEEDKSQNTIVVKAKTYKFLKKEAPKLSPKARDLSIQWEAFSQFIEEIQSLDGETLEGLKSKSPTLVTISDSLSVKIPDTLNTKLIQARVLVAKTRVKILDQEINKGRPDTLKIKTALTKLNRSLTNLIIQINQKVIKSSIDRQRSENEKKELEKQKQFLDSVYKAELANKKLKNK